MGLGYHDHLHELDCVHPHPVVVSVQQIEDLIFDVDDRRPNGLHVIRHNLGFAQPGQDDFVKVSHGLHNKNS